MLSGWRQLTGGRVWNKECGYTPIISGRGATITSAPPCKGRNKQGIAGLGEAAKHGEPAGAGLLVSAGARWPEPSTSVRAPHGVRPLEHEARLLLN